MVPNIGRMPMGGGELFDYGRVGGGGWNSSISYISVLYYIFFNSIQLGF